MNHQHVKYLIAGGGLAGSAAAAAIRQLDPTGSLLMVGQESSRPYRRSPLSKDYLLGRARHERPDHLFILTEDRLAAQHIELQTGRRVERLDTARHAVTLDNGEAISYDRLLLATGAVPRRLEAPGADLPNVFSVRTIADVERLGNAIDKARAEGLRHAPADEGGTGRPAGTGRGRAAVIGGGVLGSELAGSLAAAGLAVNWIVGSAHPWHRFAGSIVARFLSQHLQARGVTVHNAKRAVCLEGDGRAQRVICNEGTRIACDFAITAVGAIPQRELLRNTSIAAETAILTDIHCRTSEPDIYAAGDCAAALDPRYGKHRWIDHAAHAAAAGAVAGTNMAGGHAGLDEVPDADTWTTTTAGITATIAGEPRLVYRRILRGDVGSESAGFAEIGVDADGRVAQILAIGSLGEWPALQQLLAARALVDGNEQIGG